MKGMNKISRGRGFAGTIEYAQFGEKGAHRAHEGLVIGGNMSSVTVDLIVREFNASKQIRPDVKKPVWHNSLRLPKGETLSHKTWSNIGDRYMEEMGFSTSHPRVYFLHDDKDGQHIHIIASRISYDGKLFLGKNENLRSTKIIGRLEVEFGLITTKAVSHNPEGRIKMPAHSKVTKNETEKSARLGKEPERLQLQKLVNQVLKHPLNAAQFVESLHSAGVNVRVNIARTGRLNGFTFGLNGVYFSGSKLGAAFTCASLAHRGMTYDKDRDGEFLSRFRSEGRDNPVYSRSAPAIDKSRSDTHNLASNRGGGAAPNLIETDPKQSIGSHGGGLGVSASTFSAQLSGDHAPSFGEIDPDSKAAPLQTGDPVADEFSRKLHSLRLLEANRGASSAGKLWTDLFAHQAAEKAAQEALDVLEEAKRDRIYTGHEMRISISQKLVLKGYGFAMQSKIRTKTEDDPNATTIPDPDARKNNREISLDAAPRGR
jgi:hypothetical protein